MQARSQPDIFKVQEKNLGGNYFGDYMVCNIDNIFVCSLIL